MPPEDHSGQLVEYLRMNNISVRPLDIRVFGFV